MDDDDAKHLLLTIRRMVFDDIYPIKEGDVIDPRYAIAFGLIAGICTEALQAKAQDRPARLAQFTQDEQKRPARTTASSSRRGSRSSRVG